MVEKRLKTTGVESLYGNPGLTLPEHGFGLVSAPLLTASFDVAHLIVEKELSLIKPAVVRMVDLFMGSSATEKIKQIPLSKDTVRRRNCSMGCGLSISD